MSQQPTVADYIVRRLAREGITDCFGVPGDFAFKLDDAVARNEAIRWIGCSNELDAAYAADGYARVRGCSMLLTTYAVGELSALNGVMGAKAERSCVFHLNNGGYMVERALERGPGLGLQRPRPLELSRPARRPGLPRLVHGESHHARRARRRAGQGGHGRIGERHRGRRRPDGLPGGTRHGPSAPRRPVREWLAGR